MKVPPTIVLAEDVHRELSRLIERVPEDMITDQLAYELERATLVAPDELPKHVVTMHSTVTFSVESTGKTFTYTLVYPAELNDTDRQLSILSPVGSAIIGLQQGASIDWRIAPTKQTTISVDAIQPPAP